MYRCPEHPDHIQVGIQKNGKPTCTVWNCKGKWTDDFRCGRIMEPISREERDKLRLDKLTKVMKETPLPDWVIVGIKQIAWDCGHSCGQEEVDNYIMSWIDQFEENFKNSS